jgi:hypothetical protein
MVALEAAAVFALYALFGYSFGVLNAVRAAGRSAGTNFGTLEATGEGVWQAGY